LKSVKSRIVESLHRETGATIFVCSCSNLFRRSTRRGGIEFDRGEWRFLRGERCSGADETHSDWGGRQSFRGEFRSEWGEIESGRGGKHPGRGEFVSIGGEMRPQRGETRQRKGEMQILGASSVRVGASGGLLRARCVRAGARGVRMGRDASFQGFTRF
jgi:hypothetical protein